MARLKVFVLLLIPLLVAMTIGMTYANPPIETLRPDEDVHTGMFQVPSSGSHYEKVNEATPDGDNTYVYDQANGFNYDLFGLPDISSGYTINSVTVYAVARDWFDSPFDFRILIKTHGSILPDPTDPTVDNIVTTGSYEAYSKTWTTNPITNSLWTTSEVNDLQVGVQATYGSGYVSVTQLYVEVDVTPQLLVPESPFGVMGALGSMALTFAAVMVYRRAHSA